MRPFKKKATTEEAIREPDIGAGIDYPTCVPANYLEELENYEENQIKE